MLNEYKVTFFDYIGTTLTLNLIDRLQNYYGIAIRQNLGDLVGMKKAQF